MNDAIDIKTEMSENLGNYTDSLIKYIQLK